MKKHWSDVLVGAHACEDALTWAREQSSAREAWASCPRADWMLWIAGKLCDSEERRKKVVFAACQCARTALKHTKDPRVLACIETVERWCVGNATLEEVKKARAAAAAAAAYAAAYAANAAANAAAAYAARKAQTEELERRMLLLFGEEV